MDPITALIALVPLAVTTVEGAEKLIAHLQDHQRTLEAAEADRRAARERLDGPK